MMDFKKNIFVCVLMTGFCALPIVYADEADHSFYSSSKWHERMEKKREEIYGQLNLTEGQKKQLEANKKRHHEDKRVVFEKMKSYKESFKQELMKPDLDMSKINEIQSQFKAVQSQMTDDRLRSILEVRKILTPQQFTKFISLMEKHKHEGH